MESRSDHLAAGIEWFSIISGRWKRELSRITQEWAPVLKGDPIRCPVLLGGKTHREVSSIAPWRLLVLFIPYLDLPEYLLSRGKFLLPLVKHQEVTRTCLFSSVPELSLIASEGLHGACRKDPVGLLPRSSFGAFKPPA